MQTRATAQLAKKLRSQHALTNSWDRAALACNVLTADGRPDKGMAFLIAMRGYEPARPETRARLGLKKKSNPRPRGYSDMPVNELAWCFEHRKEMA